MNILISILITWIFLISIIMTFASGDPEENLTDMIANAENVESTKLLSRRKRFLTFPDGSSFQLVICTQNHGYLQIGDVVWFGNTAALAWELPSNPTLFHLYKQYERPYDALRRHDTKHVIFLDENGKVISTKPYRRKPIINPAFAKRSVGYENSDIDMKITVKEMHENQKNISYFDNLDEKSIENHRKERKSLYDKLETLLEGLGWRGKDCILRMLCETPKANHKHGTFLEEILKATFTLPRGNKMEMNEDYEIAHHSGMENCEKLYPQCEDRQGYQMFDQKS